MMHPTWHKVLFWLGPLLTLAATVLIAFVLILLGSFGSNDGSIRLDPVFSLLFIPSALGVWEQVYMFLAIYKGRPVGKILLIAHVGLSALAGLVCGLLAEFVVILQLSYRGDSSPAAWTYILAALVGLLIMAPYASLPFYYRAQLKHG